jgi:hypothetical protein
VTPAAGQVTSCRRVHGSAASDNLQTACRDVQAAVSTRSLAWVVSNPTEWSYGMYDVYAVLISTGCYGFVILLRHVLERI